MSGIVCAVRGGPECRETIGQAIAKARETGLPLIFLYVVNLDFLSHTSSSRVRTISEQMEGMGEFILLTARSTAAESGVIAEGVIRHGKVHEEITRLCREVAADYVVLGRPKRLRQENVFTYEQLQHFVERTQEKTGAQVILAGETDP